MLSEEALTTNYIVFDLTRQVPEPKIYHTCGEHAYDYTTDALFQIETIGWKLTFHIFFNV